MSHLRDKYRHRVGWESAPTRAFCPALRQYSSRRGAGLYPVLLGRATIFGHEENDGLQDSPWAGFPCGVGGDGREEPTSQYHTCLEGKAIEEIWDFLEWVGGDHQDGTCGLSGHGFDTRGHFIFWLPCSRLSGCFGFGLRLLRPGLLPGGGHFKLTWHLRDRLRRWFWIKGRGGGSSLDNMPLSNYLSPSLT